MAILNNLVIGLYLSNGFPNLASARRYFDAHPKAALDMLVSTDSLTLRKPCPHLPLALTNQFHWYIIAFYNY